MVLPPLEWYCHLVFSLRYPFEVTSLTRRGLLCFKWRGSCNAGPLRRRHQPVVAWSVLRDESGSPGLHVGDNLIEDKGGDSREDRIARMH
jgi:hypothetical protein